MLFEKTITIPANTSKSDPVIETVHIAHGIISKFMVRPHAGHAGLAHCVIRYHGTQIAPSTEGMNLHGDADPIDWEDYYEVYGIPYILRIEGWNDDDTYEHSFDIFIAILPRKAILALAITDTIAKLFNLFNPRRIFTGGKE